MPWGSGGSGGASAAGAEIRKPELSLAGWGGPRHSPGSPVRLPTPPPVWPSCCCSEPWLHRRAGVYWPLLLPPTVCVPGWVLRRSSPWEGCERSQEVLQPQPPQRPVPAAAAAGRGPSRLHGRAWPSPGGTLPSAGPREETAEQAGSGRQGQRCGRWALRSRPLPRSSPGSLCQERAPAGWRASPGRARGSPRSGPSAPCCGPGDNAPIVCCPSQSARETSVW